MTGTRGTPKKKKRRKKDERPRELVQSGALCVAFANTAASRPDHRFRVSDPPPETLPESFAAYEDLLAWGRRMGIAEAAGADARPARHASDRRR
jgi:hypothetical protein